jgi:DNA mismatch repair protein MutS2
MTKISERVLDILEWDRIIEEIQQRCETEPGRDYLEQLVPLARDDVRSQLRKITELKELISRNESPDFSGVTNIKPTLEIARKRGILKLGELYQIRNFIIASNRIRAYLHNNSEEITSLRDDADGLDRLEKIGDLLITSITDNEELNNAKYPELKKLSERVYSTRQEIEKQLSRLMNSPAMAKVLQERVYTSRNERYVLLVKSSMRGQINGTVHDVSSSGATLFIEPDSIKGLNSNLIMLELELQVEINRILKKLSAAVGSSYSEIKNNLEMIAYLDFISASSLFSIATSSNEPDISDQYTIELYNARHPLLYLMSPEQVVGNDIFLGQEYTCLIISGANTGGKTVLLKTIGLCSLLVMHGLHIPASPDSKIGVFSKILADIGDEQSLAQSLSTYSGQIVIIDEMLKRADPESLIIIDEIIVSTNPRQGAALAQAILEELIDTDAKIVVTTHYSELKELASSDQRFQNASVSFDRESLKPTYKLTIGIPGVSYTIEIARNYGIPENIISRSSELLDSRELSTEALIEKMQQYEQEMQEERRKLELFSEELKREKREYKDKKKKLSKREEDIKFERGVEFLNELKEHRRGISDKIRSLQNADIRRATEIQGELTQMQQGITDKLRESRLKGLEESYISFDPDKVAIGESVFISTLGKSGIVESVDLTSRNVQIILGNNIKSRFPFEEVFLIPESKERRGTKRKREKKKGRDAISADGTIPVTLQTRYNTVDLRGCRVEEALNRMETEFDKMTRSGIRTAVVIHGHGTGALKEAVRNNLRFSSYVLDFRTGEYGEGGDGVTIVLLRD